MSQLCCCTDTCTVSGCRHVGLQCVVLLLHWVSQRPHRLKDRKWRVWKNWWIVCCHTSGFSKLQNFLLFLKKYFPHAGEDRTNIDHCTCGQAKVCPRPWPRMVRVRGAWSRFRKEGAAVWGDGTCGYPGHAKDSQCCSWRGHYEHSVTLIGCRHAGSHCNGTLHQSKLHGEGVTQEYRSLFPPLKKKIKIAIRNSKFWVIDVKIWYVTRNFEIWT